MNKTSIGAIAMMLALGSVLAACSKSGDSKTPPGTAATSAAPTSATKETAPAKPVEISFWYEPGGEAGKLFETMAKEFNDSQKAVIVKPVFVDPGNFTTKTTAALVAKNPPDTALVIHQHVPNFKQSLVPVEDMMKGDSSFQKDQFYESEWSMMTLDNKIYSLPYETTNLGIIYNKDMFTAAGVNAPKTWDELRDVARKLTNPDKKEFGMIFPVGSNDPFFFQPFIWQNGGDFMNKDRTDVTFDTPEVLGAIQLLADMIQKDKSIPLTPPENGFLSGKVGMTLSGPWEVPSFSKNAKFQWGALPLPKGKQNATNVGGTTLVMFKSTPEREKAAWTFLKYMSSKEAAIRLTTLGWLPIRKDAEASPEWKAKIAELPQLQVFMDQMQYGRLRPFGDHYDEIAQAFMDGLNAVFYGKMTPSEGMRTATEKSRAILKK